MTTDPKTEMSLLRARTRELKERLEHSEDVNENLRASIKTLTAALKKEDGSVLRRRMHDKETESENVRAENSRLRISLDIALVELDKEIKRCGHLTGLIEALRTKNAPPTETPTEATP